jgi:hypothetical protein
LPGHAVRTRRTSVARLRRHLLLECAIIGMRRVESRTSVIRARSRIRTGHRHRGLRRHPGPWNKGLRLGIELAIVTPRDRMLALRVIRICMRRKLPVGVGDSSNRDWAVAWRRIAILAIPLLWPGRLRNSGDGTAVWRSHGRIRAPVSLLRRRRNRVRHSRRHGWCRVLHPVSKRRRLYVMRRGSWNVLSSFLRHREG